MSGWRAVTYFAVYLPNRPGELARFCDKLHGAGCNLLGMWGYAGDDSDAGAPARPRLSCVPESAEAFRQHALGEALDFDEGEAMYLQAPERPGALVETLDRIAAIGINIDAIECVSSGESFGWFLWPAAGDREALADLLER